MILVEGVFKRRKGLLRKQNVCFMVIEKEPLTLQWID
jgi:hypothetical protein